jgi:hypothetical protein
MRRTSSDVLPRHRPVPQSHGSESLGPRGQASTGADRGSHDFGQAGRISPHVLGRGRGYRRERTRRSPCARLRAKNTSETGAELWLGEFLANRGEGAGGRARADRRAGVGKVLARAVRGPKLGLVEWRIN